MEERQPFTIHTCKTFMQHFLRYWPTALASIVSMICEALCDLMQPTLIARMINEGVQGGDMQLVFHYAARMLAITGLGMTFAIARSLFSSNTSQRFGRDLRLDMYAKIQRISLDSVDQFERASIITRMTNDINQLQNFLNGMMRFFLRAPVYCIGGVILAATLSPRMASVLAITIPIAAIIITLSMKIGYPYFYKVQIMLDKLNGGVREYLSGVRVVKAFNRFLYEKQRFEESNENLTKSSATAMRVTAAFGPAVTLVVNLGIAAAVIVGGRAGEPNGNLIAFVNYMGQILFALTMFSMIFNQMVRALVSGRRINAILQAENGMDTTGTAVCSKVMEGLTFENVGFTYQNASSPALSHISFAAAPGQTVGIIGSTGAGKSSLIHLLPRFYDVTEGRVLLDGTDIAHMDIHNLRDRISIVPQQNVLFTGTIADNLRWGKADATEDEMWQALRIAQAEDFVRGFPEGLESQLGRGGVNVSGGQKQRLSIARALIKQPDILILDDCTSAVDVTTEAQIRGKLQEFARHLLCIVISQRITSIMTADLIVVLDEGQIAGMGTHAELMNTCDVYRDIYHSQIGKELEDVG